MAKYIDVDALGIGMANPDVFIVPAYADGWNSAIKILQDAPAADVRPVVRGEWIYEEPNSGNKFQGAWYCSKCKYPGMPVYDHFCHHCGADMRKEVSGDAHTRHREKD